MWPVNFDLSSSFSLNEHFCHIKETPPKDSYTSCSGEWFICTDNPDAGGKGGEMIIEI